MPFIEPPSHRGVKRKRPTSQQDALRERPINAPVAALSRDAEIERLEVEIKLSRKNYNNIAALIAIAFPQNSANCNDAAVVALCRSFGRIVASGAFEQKNGMTKAELAVLSWLQNKYREFSSLLTSLISQGQYSCGLDVLQLIMRLVKQEVSSLGSRQWAGGIFAQALRGLLQDRETASEPRKSFIKTYFKFDDVRYHTAATLPLIIDDLSSNLVGTSLADAALEILFAFPSPPTDDADLCSIFVADRSESTSAALSRKSYIRKLQDAWLAVFRLSLSSKQRKRILGLLVHRIVPWFAQPERFMDFLTDSYNEGGETTLLALAGLFHLMQEKNLDYPSFFTKLYSLLDEDILHSKHRARFFRLLDTFMASTHLSAALIASFIKRLCRLALAAPPSGIVMVVPWVYNMFQNHPSTTFMMHRIARCKEEEQEWEAFGAEDPFDMDQLDPMSTGAIDSSVWELYTLQSHYHPNVATLAKIISEQFTKQQYNLEDFLDHSYDSLLDVELEKTLKKSVVVEYVIPQSILKNEKQSDAGLEEILRLVMEK